MSAIIFDTETTGHIDPRIVEAAWVAVSDPVTRIITSEFEQRYNPEKPIELGALATHHILDEELADCPPYTAFTLPPDIHYLIGHNVDYDWQVIGEPDVKRICTMALSRSLFPEADSHSQSAMIYLLERETARERLKNAHSAKHDVLNCHVLLRHLIDMLSQECSITTWEDLWEASEKARMPKTMPFGKYKGTPIQDVPSDYRRWLLQQPDVDPYLIKALTQ